MKVTTLINETKDEIQLKTVRNNINIYNDLLVKIQELQICVFTVDKTDAQ